MQSRRLGRSFDRQRLRWLLLVLFLALAIPTAVLVGQAWRQLKWEAFHQYRGSAEELTARIDARLGDLIDTAERRSFAEFSFLLEPQTAASNVVQRSPLSNFPVDEELPGLLGYFQVDSDGRFSTPLLPASRQLGEELGLDAAEYDARLEQAENIRSVLAENRLVQSRPAAGAAVADFRGDTDVSRDEQSAEGRAAEGGEARELREQDAYTQQVFDALKRARPAAEADEAAADAAVSGEAGTAERERANAIGKLSDIPLDPSLQKKSEQLEKEDAAKARDDREALYQQASTRAVQSPAATVPGREPAAAAPIRTFASEVDPFEFSILDSGQFVLFRNVWRGGERHVQGLLIESRAFIEEVIGESFASAALAGTSNLIVAYEDDVLASFAGRDAGSRYPAVSEELGGALLYRSRLGAPLDSLELIYSVRQLPPGPGSRILLWLSLVLGLVFVGGFTILYRLGASQIRLAQQQQDFVSAVSHELKTPLTSIRMYGEMLKEGWADEAKRQGYYEFIHDEAERLSRLIANVLQLASITRNEPQLNIQPVPVRQLMDNVESRISSQVERAGFTLSIRRDETADDAVVMIDSDCFIQVVINLVDNATKFSRHAERKLVEIACRTVGKDVMFSVRDYGPGIPKDQMQKIFQLFYRSESELTRETVGTGIGLAIVHQLTLAMGGSVDLVNAEPGAEFRLRFPVS